MSKIIDSKVVEMRFDNTNFERNVKTSMSTLDKLKQALKLDGATKALTDVENRANNVKFNGIVNSIDALSEKLTGIGMVGTVAMARISNAVIDAGKTLVKQLSTDNIYAGWNKLQQKANSMSTLISQGYSTETVEKQLERLLWFSDETSYNFTDMIDNISKFTATGKGLTESVNAMQGISLWAAKSGQNAQKASMAMYQLSQALGAGYMRREDWKSIQNYSMDTDEFRQVTLDTAVALGTLKKVGKDTYKSLTGDKKKFTKSQFAESLTQGQWFTADVMMKVYGKYSKGAEQVKKLLDTLSDKTNGELDLTATQLLKLYKTVEPIFSMPDTPEANNKYLKALDDVLGEQPEEDIAIWLYDSLEALDKFGISALKAGQEYRTFNDAVDATKDAVSTKWMSIFETILGNVDQQKDLWTTIGEKFYDWFAAPLDELQSLLNKWVKLGGRDSLFTALSNIGKAIKAIVDPIKDAFRDVFPKTTANTLLDITNKFKDFTSKLIITEKTAKSIQSIFRAFFQVVKTGITIIKTVASALFKLIGVFKPLGSLILEGVSALAKWIDKVATAAQKSKWLTTALTNVVNVIKAFVDAVGKMVKKLFSYESFVKFFTTLGAIIQKLGSIIGNFISTIIKNGNLKEIMSIINSGLLSALIIKLKNLTKTVDDTVGSLKKNIFGILTELKNTLQSYQKDLNAKALQKIAIAIGILVASLWVLSTINPEKLAGAIGSLTLLMTELLAAFAVLNKIAKDKKILARSSLALVSLSISLLVLSAAIKNIASLSFGQMITGLIGLAGAMGVLVAAIYALPDDGKTKKKTKGLITLSLSLLILSIALKKIGTMDILSIVKGLFAIIVSLSAMAIILSKMKSDGALRKSVSLLILANSLLILSLSLKLLATMSWDDIARSLTAMSGALLIFGIIMNILPKKGNIFKSAGLLIAVTSLIILGGALKILATMKWNDIARALVAMGGALTELTIAMKIMGSNTKSAITGAGALVVASAALITLATGLKILGSMDIESIGKSLLALAGVLTILGIAGSLLSEAMPAILGIAAAAFLFGAASVAFGVGLSLIAAGITALSLALTAGATSIAAGVTAIILGILGAVPELLKTIKLIIIELCNILIECAPLLGEAIGTAVLSAITMLKDYIPQIVTTLLDYAINVIRALTSRIPELVVSIAELLSAVFTGFKQALAIMDTKELIGGLQCLTLLTATFILLASLATLAPAAALGIIAFGGLLIELMSVLSLIAKAKGKFSNLKDAGDVLENVGTVIGKFIGSLIGNLASSLSNSLPNIATNLSAFMTNIKPFLDGIKNIPMDSGIRLGSLGAGIYALAASNFATGVSTLLTFGHSLPELGTDLSEFMNNCKDFIDGAKIITPNMIKGVTALSACILILTGANLIKSIADFYSFLTGGTSFAKFGEEIADLGSGMKKFVKNLGTFDEKQVYTIKAACQGLIALAQASSKIPNEGGILSGIVGDNSIGMFADELPDLGIHLTEFVTNLNGFNENDAETISCVGQAILSLANAAKEIPNEGGLWALLAGDNSISTFADKLPAVGLCLSAMAASLTGFGQDSVTVIKSAAEAIVEMANAASKIPNSGGLVALFTGDNDIALFGLKLPLVGKCLTSFVKNLKDFDSTAMEKVKAAGETIVTLANAATKIPNSGGIVKLFTGDNDISQFASKLPDVANGLKDFVTNLTKDGPFGEDQISTVDCAGRAIVALADAASKAPSVGGIVSWFTGENDISAFSSKFPDVASDLVSFVKTLTKDGTFGEEQIKTVDCAGRALAALGEATANIPPINGLLNLFTGEKDISKFSSKLPGVAVDLKSFVTNLTKDGPFGDEQIKSVKAGSEALKEMVNATSDIEDTGGFLQIFTGSKDLKGFAKNLPEFGTGLNGLITKLGNFSEDKVNIVKAATEALKYVVYFNNDVKDINGLIDKSKKLKDLSEGITNFINGLAKIDKDKAEEAKVNSKAFYDITKELSNYNLDAIKSLSESMSKIGKDSIDKFIDAFAGQNAQTRVSQGIRDLILKLLDAMEAKRSEIENKMLSIANSTINKLKDLSVINGMKEAGKNFAKGFADGINDNKHLAVDAGTKLGNAAYEAAKRAIDSHSPSKKAMKLGNFFGLGFVNGIHDYTSDVYNESYLMAEQASKGLSKAISSVNDILNDEGTNQPVIRPVLDLSDVENGINNIGSMFGSPSIGLLNNLNSVSSSMNYRSQNGPNKDIVSAIDKLNNSINSDNKSGNTYNINGVTYDDGSAVSDAVSQLIRAINVERRV